MHDNHKFRGKFRNESARKPSWDYAKSGRYFITICTGRRFPWFGKIHDGVMHLSNMGAVVNQFWSDIPHHFPHVTLDAFIVMPDHVHGIIIIGKRPRAVVGTFESNVPTPTGGNDHHTNFQYDAENKRKIPRRPSSGSIGSIIGQFKSVCTKHLWKTGHTHFTWQSRFHDHVIRDDAEFIRIRRYIIDNPRDWRG